MTRPRTAPLRIDRRRHRRREFRRRRGDAYKEVGKFAGLVAFASTAVVGQAELIGEPWRHYVTVAAVLCTAVWAYCMKPDHLLSLLKRR